MTTAKRNPCWPGYEPVPGKKPRTKGSCKPVPGTHSKATKRATQESAARTSMETLNSTIGLRLRPTSPVHRSC
jgi:hypothetical protein